MPRHSAGGMYVRTYVLASEACAETTWMHAQATHPQTMDKQESGAACMLVSQPEDRYKQTHRLAFHFHSDDQATTLH